MVRKLSKRNVKNTLRAKVRRRIASNLVEEEWFLQNPVQETEQFPPLFDSDSDCDESGSTKLRKWAVKNNITRNALTELLKILISFGLTWLPSDSRTLLETPQSTQLVNVANGEL